MNRRRVLALGVAVAVLASVGGTGGFGSASVDRGVQVAVVDDEAAYLGIESDDASDGTWNVTVTNRLPGGTTLDVVVEVGERTDATTLRSGESDTLTLAGVDCGVTANLTASATGGGVTIVASRAVSCSGATVSSTPTGTPGSP